MFIICLQNYIRDVTYRVIEVICFLLNSGLMSLHLSTWVLHTSLTRIYRCSRRCSNDYATEPGATFP